MKSKSEGIGGMPLGWHFFADLVVLRGLGVSIVETSNRCDPGMKLRVGWLLPENSGT